jgi:membrane protease YdiL (CAAX protease family)
MSNDSFKYTPSQAHMADPPVVPVHPKSKPTERRTELPEKPRWNPLVAVGFVMVVYILAVILGSALVVLYPHLRGWDKAASDTWLDHSIAAQFWFVLLTESIMFAGVWWFLRYHRTGLKAIGWRMLRWKDPLYALIAVVVYIVAYMIILGLVTHFFPSINVNQKQELGFVNPRGTENLLLTFVSLVVLPPLVEETAFRGLIFTGLRAKLNLVWSTLITSVLFASLHLEFGSGKPLLWVAAIDTFTLSLVLCYLREKTNSLWPGILLHALKNSIAFITLFLIGPF